MKVTTKIIATNLFMFKGNLCRCTGYRPILEGFRTFSKEAGQLNGCGKSNCCMVKTSTAMINDYADCNGKFNSFIKK